MCKQEVACLAISRSGWPISSSLTSFPGCPGRSREPARSMRTTNTHRTAVRQTRGEHRRRRSDGIVTVVGRTGAQPPLRRRTASTVRKMILQSSHRLQFSM